MFPFVAANPCQEKPSIGAWILACGKDGTYCLDVRDPKYAAGEPAARLRLAQDSVTHPASGEQVTLFYELANADRAVIEPGGHLVTGRLGLLEVTVQETTKSTLTASGDQLAALTVPVVPAVQMVTASRATTVPAVPVELNWKAANTQGVTINPDIGDKPAFGSVSLTPRETMSPS